MALTLLSTTITARVEPDVVLCNAAVSACAATGDWQNALVPLRRRIVEPNVITYNAAQLNGPNLDGIPSPGGMVIDHHRSMF